MSTQETESDNRSTHTVANNNLSVKITKKTHCQVQFDIKINPKAVEAAYHRTLKKVSIPGFRKGRAPESIILENYGSAIQQDFVDLVIQTGFNEAVQLAHIYPLKDGYIKSPILKECSREKGADFTIEFEARPNIPSVDIENLRIHKSSPKPITDQDRQNAIQNLLLQLATYSPIENRAVKEDDFVNVSVTILEEPYREIIKNQRTQVNDNGLPIWLRQKVIGLKSGESAEGMTEQDSALEKSDPDFRPVPFRITVHDIWEGHLPAIDEELAKRVGLTSVEELHKKINERLEHEAEEDALRSQVRSLEETLIENYPIDLPQSYIDANTDFKLKDYFQRVGKQQSDYSQEEYRQIKQSIEQSTVLHLQIFFLLRKVASDHNIKVNEREIEAEFSRQLVLNSNQLNNLDFNDQRKLHEQLHNIILDRKTQQFLIAHATDHSSS